MSDLYSNDKIRIKAEQLVQQNVHYCVSMLISSIANPQQPERRGYGNAGIGTEEVCTALGLDYDEDLMPLLEITDYEEAAERHIDDDMDADELRSYLESVDVEFEAPVDAEDADEDTPATEGTPIEELRKLAIEHIKTEADADREFCNEFNVEPDRSEVYEHWIVDNWFAGKLEAEGQPIARDFLGMTIWGRPTTGQSISMDYVILKIAQDCLRREA